MPSDATTKVPGRGSSHDASPLKAGRSEPIAVGYRPFTVREYRRRRAFLTEVALRTSKAVVIAQELAAALRADRIIVPSARVIDRCCAEALARGMRLFYQRLADSGVGYGQ